MPSRPTGPVLGRLRTLGALGLVLRPRPAVAVATGAALVRRAAAPAASSPAAVDPGTRCTVLLSGGKMTKSLALARAFHAAGHRVVLMESARYRLTGHRFSRAVDTFRVGPAAGDPGYAEALLRIVCEEHVDVYVPVCSPASSGPDARAVALLAGHCEVVHADAGRIDLLDDKALFAETAAGLGLAVPDTHRVTDAEQVLAFDFTRADRRGRRYVLKSIAYDPVHRLDLTPLPRSTPQQTADFVRSKPISPDNPWILQELVEGEEFCTHGTVRDGRLQVWVACRSSAFQVNYEAVDKPALEEWVRVFVEAVGLTGQASFDFIETADGTTYALECNPRTHSAITLFAGHPDLARAYLEPLGDDEPAVVPLPGARPTYWLAHEAWRALRHPGTARQRLAVVRAGRDAVWDPDDPLPFLALHALHLPGLLLGNLLRGRDWVKVDANIGKLVEPAGD